MSTMRLRSMFGWNVPVGLPVKVDGQPIGRVTGCKAVPWAGTPSWIVDMEVSDCRQCERRTDGWRRLLFWRLIHNRRCPVARLIASQRSGRIGGMSIGGRVR